MLDATAVSRSGAGLGFSVQTALREIYGLSTGPAFMGFVKFIGKNLFLRAAFRTGADKGLQMFIALKTGAVLWCRHGILLNF